MKICDKIFTNGSVRTWESQNLVPYLIYDEKYWVSYEDTHSIAEKMLFIKANNLSGAFLWSIDLDDFQGEYCNQGKFPLLKAINTELNALDSSPQSLNQIEKNVALKSNSNKTQAKIYKIVISLFIYISFIKTLFINKISFH